MQKMPRKITYEDMINLAEEAMKEGNFTAEDLLEYLEEYRKQENEKAREKNK